MSAEHSPTLSSSDLSRLTLPCATVRLRPGTWKPLAAGHPWVWESAIASVDGSPRDGQVVDVLSDNGTFLGRGVINHRSRLRVRIYSRSPDLPLNEAFWFERVDQAVRWRENLRLLQPANAVRLVFSEADGLSGLVVDRYEDHVVVQVNALAIASRLELFLDILQQRLHPGSVIVRTSPATAKAEGIAGRDGVARGVPPDQPVRIFEGSVAFDVDITRGQKTGYYIDHRFNRQRVASYFRDRHVLDVFCYTGGFGLHALRHGQAASVVGVDSSQVALDLAEHNARLNGVQNAVQWIRQDAFTYLHDAVAAGCRFGAVVLDPPKFAAHRSALQEALRAYHRLNRLAIQLLEPEGVLVTCSCSGNVSRTEFLDMLFGVAQRSGRTLQIVEQLGHAPDHPVSLACPESEYLKCIVCRVI